MAVTEPDRLVGLAAVAVGTLASACVYITPSGSRRD